jgi:RNA polymerase sigma-70 factor (ECF subfamily)
VSVSVAERVTAEPPPDLAPLIADARKGGAGAFVEIHRRFAAVVHGIALAHVAPSDADDVTQETFVRVHRTLASIREAVAFPAWICQVARNVAIDHARRQRRRPKESPLPEDRAAQPAPATDDELRAAALRCLAKLPDAYRETLFLRLAEGLSGPEIASRTGLTPESVRVNLCRGMAMLRPLLREEGWS